MLKATFPLFVLIFFSTAAQAQTARQNAALAGLLAHDPGEWIGAAVNFPSLLAHDASYNAAALPGTWEAAAVCLTLPVDSSRDSAQAARCSVLGRLPPEETPAWLPPNGRFLEPLMKYREGTAYIEAACVADLRIHFDNASAWQFQFAAFSVDVDDLRLPDRTYDEETGIENPVPIPALPAWNPSHHTGIFGVHRLETNGTQIRRRTEYFGSNLLEDELAHATRAWNSSTWLDEDAATVEPWPAETPRPHCSTLRSHPHLLLCHLPAQLLFGYARTGDGTDHCRVWRRSFDDADPYVIFVRSTGTETAGS